MILKYIQETLWPIVVSEVLTKRDGKIADWGSISPTFYNQLLHAKIPKAQKI